MGIEISLFLLVVGVFMGISWLNVLCLIPVFINGYIIQVFGNFGKEATAEIALTQANNNAFIENTNDAVWMVNEHLQLVSFNVNFANMFKSIWQKEAIMGMNILNANEQITINDQWNAWYKKALSGESFNTETAYDTEGGCIKIELFFTPIFKDKTVNGVIIKSTDISLRKEAELAQLQQSEFLNKLIAHLPIGVFVKQVKNGLTYTLWNKELENLFNLKEEEVIGKTDEEVFKNAGEILHYLATDQLILRDKEPILIQKLCIQAEGKQIFARTIKIPLLDANGEVESIFGILENITDSVNAQEELAVAEKRWNYALSGSRDAVWDVDLVNNETFFSPVFSEMLGYKAYQQLEESWEDLVHPEDLPKAWNLFVDHLEGLSHFYECEYRLRKMDGSYFWVLDRGKVAETDAEGNPTRVIGTFSNIDYRKRLEEEYKHALQKAEEASHAKSLFLSTMSHEIRTPLNGVIGFIDFSKIDAGKMDLEVRPFNLIEILQNTTKSFLNSAKEKGLSLQLMASKDIPAFLLGDSVRISQIINNLLSNGIKFTEKGEVGLMAKFIESKNNIASISFEVWDTGIGIEQEYLPQLFEHFTQAYTDTTRKYGGTGLGLAICKKLVDIMGGNLIVESDKGKGTKFSFTLKLAIANTNTEEIKSARLPENIDFSGLNVLLVEDNQVNVMVAKQLLNRWNIQVDAAVNGKDALVWVKRKKYDLILMDLQMPEMDGFESASIMRKAGISTPIFAISANVNSDARENVIASGMNDYISKPFKPSELSEKINSIYQQKKAKKIKDDSPKNTLF